MEADVEAKNPFTLSKVSMLTLERVNGFLASTSASIVSDGVDAISTNVPFREGKTATGEHLAVYSDDNGHYLVTADSFSYQPVYYRFLPASQKLVVGTGLTPGKWTRRGLAMLL